MCNKDGTFDQGKYHTIEATRKVSLSVNEERIRLGYKTKNKKGIEYPVETDYFVCPKRVKDIFGEEPTELTVYFPVANREIVFPQAYEKYGSNNAMQCQGDGEKSAQKKNQETGKWETVKCPCEYFEKECKKVGYLRFMMPSVSIGTFFQCAIHGTVSINECNSGFYTADVTTGGRWAMIPFRMRRIAKKLKIPGSAKMKTHWVVTLEVAASTEEIRRVMAGEILYLGQLKNGKKYELEAPELPEANNDIVVVETDEEKVAREEKGKVKALEEEKRQEEITENKEQLKKNDAAGKSGIRSTEEWKALNKKLAKEKAALKADIEKVARKSGINSWRELIELGREKEILPETVFSWHTAMSFLCDNKEECEKFIKVIEDYISEDDIPF